MFDKIIDWLTTIIVPAAVICVIIGLIGCGIYSACENERNAIQSGIIVDKQMSRGYTYYHSDKNGRQMHSVPASWSFTIRGIKNGEIVEYSFEVRESDYSAYKIGDEYQR